MKKALLLLLLLFVTNGCKESTISNADLKEIGGLYYLKNSETPYTGETTDYLNGSLIAINKFVDGQNILGRTFYGNGNKEYEIEFKNNLEHGYWRQYYPNGQLDYECHYVDGKRHGTATSYYENGQLQSKGNYINDEQVGESESFYKNGQSRTVIDAIGNRKTYYENGKIRSVHRKDTKEIFYNQDGEEITLEEIDSL